MILIKYLDTVVRLRPELTVDRYGNGVPDWSFPEETVIEGLSVQPRSQDETVADDRTVKVTGWRVYSRPGVDLDVVASDRIVYDGVTCDVVGEVARWRDPLTGAVHHVEFDIERRVG